MNENNLKEMLSTYGLKVSNESLGKYDFTNDGACEKYQLLTCKINKYFIYKAFLRKDGRWIGKKKEYIVYYPDGLKYSQQIRKEYNDIKDPDSESLLLRNIYTKLWSNDKLNNCKNGIIICGDTLCSAQTTIDSIMEIMGIDFEDIRKGEYSINYAITLFAVKEMLYVDYLQFLD